MAIAVDTDPTIVALDNISWSTFEALMEDMAHRRWRMTYYERVLYFMSPSPTHERVKRLIGRFIETLTLELRIPLQSGGSTTYRRKDLAQAVEPDECYYLEHEADVRASEEADLTIEPPPDLIVEVDVKALSTHRLKIYAAMGVPEVWRWLNERIRVLQLGADGEYHEVPESRVLPQMPLERVHELLARRNDENETELVYAFLEHLRQSTA